MSAAVTPWPATAGQHATTEAAALAAALSHLLARDDDRPARWLAPAFADAVERARADQLADAPGNGLNPGLDPAGPSMFRAAVARLARDPLSVAVAIRRLETTGSRRLPSWPDLICGPRPSEPSQSDASLWFG